MEPKWFCWLGHRQLTNIYGLALKLSDLPVEIDCLDSITPQRVWQLGGFKLLYHNNKPAGALTKLIHLSTRVQFEIHCSAITVLPVQSWKFQIVFLHFLIKIFPKINFLHL